MGIEEQVNSFDRVTLQDMVRQMYPVRMGLQELFFRKQYTPVTTKYVEYHIKKGSQAVSDYVRRGGESLKIGSDGYDKIIQEPPQIFNHITTESADFFKSQYGYHPYSSVTPKSQQRQKLAEDLIKLKEIQQRNILLQCSQALTTGKTTLAFDDGSNKVIDWKIPATQKLTAGITWDNDTTADPDSNILALAEIVRKQAGVQRIVVVMNEKTKIDYLNCSKVQQKRDLLRYDMGSIDVTNREAQSGLRRIGTVEDIVIYTFNEIYFKDGVQQSYIPDNKVIVASPDGTSGIHYAGLDVMTETESGIIAAQEIAYMYKNMKNEVMELRYKSAPLVSMTQADCFSILTTQ